MWCVSQEIVILLFTYHVNYVIIKNNKNMNNLMISKKMKDVFDSAKKAQKHISKLSPKEKTTLEKGWDVEHAYYSSSLEGSKIDKRDFEKIAKKVA